MPQGGRGRGPNPDKCKVSDYKMDRQQSDLVDEMRSAGGDDRHRRDSPTAPTVTPGVMKMNRGGQQMTMNHTGKRLGDCDKE